MSLLSRRSLLTALAIVATVAATKAPAYAEDRFITVASTTSTEDSGLFKHILPLFKAKSGIEVRVVAKGTGQAIDQAKRGDADVLFVHHKPSEDAFVAEGFGVQRFPVMYNDFVLVGPKSDPAGVKGGKDITAALKKIAETKAPFASRGDDSGTNKTELGLWKAAAVEPKSGDWNKALGQGMGPTLNAAAAMNAYTLADRGTWLSFKNRGELEVAVEGDKRLFNQYGVILANPAKFPHVKKAEGQAFIDWLRSPEGQGAIASYTIGGEPLFFPNAGEPGA